MKKLSEIEKGIKIKIKKIENCYCYLKLIEMGFLPDTEIKIENKSSFGGPISINISNNIICLRKQEADNIYVENI